jgi:hypothetical protein
LWLKERPARQAIRIHEQTSWSCHHGIGRWNGQCDCTPGDGVWKRNFRRAFDRLAEELDGIYLEIASRFVPNAWVLRDRYIHVILSETSLERLLFELSGMKMTSPQVQRLRLILEAQRERQRMFTSCGWFFDDFDRIEPKNNVAYAAQAVHLAYLASGVDLSSQVSADLDSVVSPRTRLRASQLFQQQLARATGI